MYIKDFASNNSIFVCSRCYTGGIGEKMASEIFRNIIEQQIDVFAGTFGDTASNIFTQNSKLIHPLEYGMYKERCARELLLYTTNKNIGISDGFIITANNHVSTQCDIIMYQNNTLPVIDNGITNFYPIEIVKGIGEVKSTLNITKFKEALIKLSKNKKMFLDRKGTMKGEKKRSGEFDEIFTFLICNKLDFDISKVNFDDIYADESDIRMRHNLILSMQDGIFVYRMQVTKFPPKQKARYLGNGGKLDAVPILWPYPHHTEIDETYICDSVCIKLDKDDKYQHVLKFLTQIRALLMHQHEYELDFVEYLNEDVAKIIEKK